MNGAYMTHPFLTRGGLPRVFAHRGLVGRMPDGNEMADNTRMSIAAAQAIGVRYLEIDVHITSDGVVVICHDDDLQRIAGDPRLVADLSFAEFETLMAKRGGLISLREALEAFPDMQFNVDIKSAAAAEPAGEIAGEFCDRVLLTSFSDSRRLAALNAAARVARSVRDSGGSQEAAVPASSPGYGGILRIVLATRFGSKRAQAKALAGFDALQIPVKQGPVRVLTPKLIAAAHRAGVEVHVWTINDPGEMRELVALGVDGIITDRADLAVEVLG